MTIPKSARFEVASKHLEEAMNAIRVFVAHTRTEPGTLLYESWQSSTNPTAFLHLMKFVDDDAEQAHRSSEQVMKLTEALYPLCTEKPRFTDWHAITPR